MFSCTPIFCSSLRKASKTNSEPHTKLYPAVMWFSFQSSYTLCILVYITWFINTYGIFNGFSCTLMIFKVLYTYLAVLPTWIFYFNGMSILIFKFMLSSSYTSYGMMCIYFIKFSNLEKLTGICKTLISFPSFSCFFIVNYTLVYIPPASTSLSLTGEVVMSW